jgi:hypothetical protein
MPEGMLEGYADSDNHNDNGNDNDQGGDDSHFIMDQEYPPLKKNRPGQRARKAKAMAMESKMAGRAWDSSINWREKKKRKPTGSSSSSSSNAGDDDKKIKSVTIIIATLEQAVFTKNILYQKCKQVSCVLDFSSS